LDDVLPLLKLVSSQASTQNCDDFVQIARKVADRLISEDIREYEAQKSKLIQQHALMLKSFSEELGIPPGAS
jgi:hypothetical protein